MISRNEIDELLVRLHEPIFDCATDGELPTKDDLCSWANSIDRLREKIRTADFLHESWMDKTGELQEEVNNMQESIYRIIDEHKAAEEFALKVISMLARGR